jgi:hypothetical protein
LGGHENGLSWKEWQLASGVDKNRFNKRLRKLTADSEIIKENGRYFVMPSTTDLADMGDDDE